MHRLRSAFAWLLLLALVAQPPRVALAQDQKPSGEKPKADDAKSDAADDDATSDDDATNDDATPAPPASGKPGAPAPPASGKPAAPPAADDTSDDAGTDEELGDELEGADVRKPPAKGKGVVAGVVTDTKFHEPLVEAQVEVVGTKTKAMTDVEGRYRLELPPGTYTLRAGYELHKSSRVEGVRVELGKITKLDHELVPDENAVEEVEVVSEVEKTSAEGQTLERKRSAGVSDGVGRADMARTPDRNAAEVAKRVVGATIVGERFVFVRGLGERYTNALLNGAPLPSTEPDRQTVPLDLFPSLVVDSISIAKQFTPDMPGDFAGGSVRIFTREFPRETLFQISLNVGYNTETTFHKRLDYKGSNTDWLGYDGGIRQLPEGIPDEKLDGAGDDPKQIFWGRKINSFMSTMRTGTPPNYGLSVVGGDSWKFGNGLKLGTIGALTYGRTYQIRRVTRAAYTREELPNGEIVPLVEDNEKGEQDIDSVRWGALVGVTGEFADDQKLRLTALHAQSADDLAQEFEGIYRGIGVLPRRTVHLEYVARALNMLQLRGDHAIKALNHAEVGWYGALAIASRDQPDTRNVSYFKTDPMSAAGAGYLWDNGPQSGFHFYSEQSEKALSAGLDYTQPIIRTEAETDTKLKFGGMATGKKRAFSARRFSFTNTDRAALEGLDFCPGDAWNHACPDQLFRSENIDGERLSLVETTQLNDEYDAALNVYSGYGMVDSALTENLRVIAGARVEVTDENFTSYDPFDHASSQTTKSAINQTDVLPSLSVVFAASRQSNTRLGVSQTLARPQLREITPFISGTTVSELSQQEDTPGSLITGNPNLTLTKISNVDLRVEHFPTLREVLAFSFFFKHFNDPIEKVIVPPNIITFANAESANLIGIELEARKGLEPIAPALKDFSVIGNLTVAHSLVELGPSGQSATSKSRPLSYQSPYVVNVAIDYGNNSSGTDARLLYNVYGPRITTVGKQGVPDTYEEPRHVVDAMVSQKLSKHFELKLNVTNILGAPVVYSLRGSQEYVRQTQPDGTQILVPGPKDPETRRYEPGRTFTLTGTYTY